MNILEAELRLLMIDNSHSYLSRGLLGLRNALLTATRGTGVLTTIFKEYAPFCGEINSRENGSLTASAQGQVTSYALDSAQNRGRMMVQPGDEVYEGQASPQISPVK